MLYCLTSGGSVGKHKTHDEENKDKRIKGQRERIKELERDVKRLKSQLKTLNDAFRKSAEFMSDESETMTVEQLIKAAEDHKKLKTVKAEYEVDGKEMTRKKFANWRAKLPKADDE